MSLPHHSQQGDVRAMSRMATYDSLPPKTRRAIANAANHIPDGVFLPSLRAGLSDGAIAQIVSATDAWAVASAEQKRDLY